jgi:hypothetical protein
MEASDGSERDPRLAGKEFLAPLREAPAHRGNVIRVTRREGHETSGTIVSSQAIGCGPAGSGSYVDGGFPPRA